MITINYTGNFGNTMFQYCFARLHAETNKFNLGTNLPPGVVKTTPHLTVTEPSKKGRIVINDTDYHNFRQKHGSHIMKLDPEYDYTFNGYFQDADLLNSHRSIVLKFFELPKQEKNTTDTLVLFRLGDFIHDGWNSEIIHYDWYNEAIKMMPGEKKFVISSNRIEVGPSTKEHEQKYIDRLYNPSKQYEIPKGGDHDFNYILTFDNIISSNSTWSWWACYLSDASNIITHEWFGHFTPKIKKSHGIHMNNLKYIKYASRSIDGDFINILEI